jgi:hypothetical protein
MITPTSASLDCNPAVSSSCAAATSPSASPSVLPDFWQTVKHWKVPGWATSRRTFLKRARSHARFLADKNGWTVPNATTLDRVVTLAWQSVVLLHEADPCATLFDIAIHLHRFLVMALQGHSVFQATSRPFATARIKR